MEYKYSRIEIVETILKSEQTKGGVFWNYEIHRMLREKTTEQGYTDEEYYIKRSEFSSKLFYTYKDIGYLTAKGPDYLFIDNWKKLNERFLLDNEDIIGLTLNDHVDGLQVSNIIDLYLYYLEYYFTI